MLGITTVVSRPIRSIAGLLAAFLLAVLLIAAPRLAAHAAEGDARSVRFEGVCTFALESEAGAVAGFVVQQGEQAVWVLVPPVAIGMASTGEANDATSPRVQLGDRVIVEGASERGPNAERIRAARIHVSGTAPLPSPLEASGTIFVDADNALRSRVRGIVQRVRCDKGVWHLALFVQGHRVYVRSARPPVGATADELVDAEVTVTGVNGSIRNSRGQLLGPLLMINGFEDIERVGDPPAEFATEFVPLDEVGRFGSASLNGHRFQTEGVVTRSSPGNYLFLQAETTAVGVETDDQETFEPGDRVRVTGFLDLGQKVRGIAAASVQRIRHESPPQPIAVNPRLVVAAGEHADAEEASYPDFANRLVRFPVTIIGKSPTQSGGSLQVTDGDTIFTVQLQPAAYRTAAQYPPGTEVALTGIVRYELSRQAEERADGRVSPFDKFLLLVHLPSDIARVRAAPWWTPVRLGLALAGVLAVLAAALAWAWVLRRQVQLHVRTIATEIRDRREAAVEYQATLRERTRLAANLHDTLLQTMAGIGFQIEACQMAAGEPEKASSMGDHLGIARRMIDHAVDDIRGSVWALRRTAVEGMTLEEAIETTIGRLGGGQAATIRVRTHGTPTALPGFISGNLMLVVQEAVFNALHHGNPRTIDIDITYDGSRSVELVVRDDGSGFEFGSQRGPADGHFGLQGMRERAERLGGRLSIDSTRGGGTAVRCTVPCREYDLAIESAPEPASRLADPPMETCARSV
jgi:signal transduction histidine kinase